MLLPLFWVCTCCGQENESAADPSQGRRQRYVEDCQVCCRPNVLSVTLDGETASADASPESD